MENGDYNEFRGICAFGIKQTLLKTHRKYIKLCALNKYVEDVYNAVRSSNPNYKHTYPTKSDLYIFAAHLDSFFETIICPSMGQVLILKTPYIMPVYRQLDDMIQNVKGPVYTVLKDDPFSASILGISDSQKLNQKNDCNSLCEKEKEDLIDQLDAMKNRNNAVSEIAKARKESASNQNIVIESIERSL